MPGITVGKNSIVAAGSIVTKSVPERSIVVGNPAKVIATIDSYMQKVENSKNNTKVYDSGYTLSGNISHIKKNKMYEELINDIGFID